MITFLLANADWYGASPDDDSWGESKEQMKVMYKCLRCEENEEIDNNRCEWTSASGTIDLTFKQLQE